jgi:hypothetical protein
VAYLFAIVGNIIDWLLAAVGQGSGWLGSIFSNVLQGILNAVLSILNSLGLTDLVNSILLFLITLPSLISAAFSIIGVIAGIVGYWIGVIIGFIITLLSSVPLLIMSIINGFNTVSPMPIYAAACTSSSTILYGPCLGMYILDNTVFAGPAYFFFLSLVGFISVNVILSTVAKIQKAFRK